MIGYGKWRTPRRRTRLTWLDKLIFWLDKRIAERALKRIRRRG